MASNSLKNPGILWLRKSGNPEESTIQVSIQEFFVKKAKDNITSERVVEPCGSKDTKSAMTVQDQIRKAETLWTLKTVSDKVLRIVILFAILYLPITSDTVLRVVVLFIILYFLNVSKLKSSYSFSFLPT